MLAFLYDRVPLAVFLRFAAAALRRDADAGGEPERRLMAEALDEYARGGLTPAELQDRFEAFRRALPLEAVCPIAWLMDCADGLCDRGWVSYHACDYFGRDDPALCQVIRELAVDPFALPGSRGSA
jgi:hypothetical protein